MNCYTTLYGSKYYCFNPINLNYKYSLTTLDDITFLFCKEDNIRNPIHRIDGPAMEYSDGSKFWYFMGKTHREDGPAEFYSRSNNYWWYYHGEWIKCKDNEEFLKIIKMKAFL